MKRFSFLLFFFCCLGGPSLSAQFQGGEGSGAARSDFFGTSNLPLTLLSFYVEGTTSRASLSWTTADEVGTDYFIVERTVDGRRFTSIGQVPAAGTSYPSTTLSYRLYDEHPALATTAHYRLKSVDLTGDFTYSDLVPLTLGTPDRSLPFVISPNPSAGDHVRVQVAESLTTDSFLLEIYDATGRHLVSRSLSAGSEGAVDLYLRDPLPAGPYVLRLSDAGGTVAGTSQLIVAGRR